jgi:membrane protein
VVQRLSLFVAVRDLAKKAGSARFEDNAPRMGAALAFYTLFSLAPVLIIVVWIAGLVFGHVAAQGEVIRQFQSLMGAQASSLIESIIHGSVQPSLSVPSAVVGFFAIVFGASGAFNELQDAFNTIWRVEIEGKSFWLVSLGQRLFSLSLVAATGFILLTSLLLNAAIATAQKSFVAFHPISAVSLHAVNFLLQFGVTVMLFALMFKVIPDVEIPWRDVWMGASVSALAGSVVGHADDFQILDEGLAPHNQQSLFYGGCHGKILHTADHENAWAHLRHFHNTRHSVTSS